MPIVAITQETMVPPNIPTNMLRLVCLISLAKYAEIGAARKKKTNIIAPAVLRAVEGTDEDHPEEVALDITWLELNPVDNCELKFETIVE